MSPWGRNPSSHLGRLRTVAVIAGRTGSYEFATLGDADEDRTVGTITYDSTEGLRRACLLLARHVPPDGLVEVLDALWRISEFHARPRPRLIPPPARTEVARNVTLGLIQRRPKVWISEE
jgi:hypothetical protein